MANKPTKHFGKWRIRWIDHDGVRRSETHDDREDAAFALERHEVEVKEIRRGLRHLAPKDYTFEALCTEWLETRALTHRRPDNDRSYIRSALRPAFGCLFLRNIGAAEIERFKVASAKKGRSPSTVNHHLTLLVSMLRHAVDIGWLDAAPRVRKHKVATFDADFRYFRTTEEIQRFLSAAGAEGAPAYSLYATAIFTGLRLGELVALRWDDVDLERHQIVVQRSHDGPTKAGDVRYVPILDPLLPVLRAHRLSTRGELVFPNTAGHMRDRADRVFREGVQRVLVRAGFPKLRRNGKEVWYVTFHCMRHSFASHWVMNGGDLFRLQRILGHKTAAMTQRYAHLAPDAFAGDLNRLDALMPSACAEIVQFPSAAKASL